jgi:membrane carboxypeptidase/penicillin-binding protein PbpC
LRSIGIPAMLEMAARLGITTLGQDSERYGLSLTLGAGEVSLLQLTTAYGVFANNGNRVQSYAVDRIADSRNKLLFIYTHPPVQRVLRPQIAYLMSDILSDRFARMRAFGESSPLDIDRPAAVKTGTTSNWRDNWTIGYTPQRVVGVWVGNADGTPMEAVSGVTGAGPVWHDVMLAAHQRLQPQAFVRPTGIVEVSVCSSGWLQPSEVCPGTGLDRFDSGSAPRDPATTHRLLAIDPVLGCRAPDRYPTARTKMRLFRELPPEAETWALTVGLPMPPRQMCAAADMPEPQGSDSPVPSVLAPAPGAVFRISAAIALERQRIALQAQAGGDVSILRIVLDGSVVVTFDEPPYRAIWQLTPGNHHIYVEVHDRSGRQVRSAVTYFVVQPAK